jgi:hypothetical protein
MSVRMQERFTRDPFSRGRDVTYGLYNKTLQLCNLRKMDRFLSNLVPSIISHLDWLELTPAYQGVRNALGACTIESIVQAPGVIIKWHGIKRRAIFLQRIVIEVACLIA